jgi:hypothetical protein
MYLKAKIATLLIVLAAIIISIAIYLTSVRREQARVTAEHLAANPVPTPDFILGITFDTSEQGDRSCIFISQGDIWETGNDRAELTWHIVSNTRFLIDGSVVTNVAVSESGMIPQDETGALTSDFGSTLQFCYGFHIDPGLHLANITTSSLSGNEFSHAWTIDKR